jgi:hypothetical protein
MRRPDSLFNRFHFALVLGFCSILTSVFADAVHARGPDGNASSPVTWVAVRPATRASVVQLHVNLPGWRTEPASVRSRPNGIESSLSENSLKTANGCSRRAVRFTSKAGCGPASTRRRTEAAPATGLKSWRCKCACSVTARTQRRPRRKRPTKSHSDPPVRREPLGGSLQLQTNCNFGDYDNGYVRDCHRKNHQST